VIKRDHSEEVDVYDTLPLKYTYFIFI